MSEKDERVRREGRDTELRESVCDRTNDGWVNGGEIPKQPLCLSPSGP